MSALGVTFLSPFVLLGLLALPLIWWLLRITPPRPREEVFPPTRILEQIGKHEQTPAKSPWWLTLLRLLMAGLVILALAEPVRNEVRNTGTSEGTLLFVLDDGWTGALNWQARKDSAETILRQASDASRPVIFALASQGSKANLSANRANEALNVLSAAEPKPIRSSLAEMASALRNQKPDVTSIVWMSNGLQSGDTAEFANVLKELNAQDITIYQPNLKSTLVLKDVANETDALVGNLVRAQSEDRLSGTLTAYDVKGRSLSSAAFEFSKGTTDAAARFVLPVELRNEIVRVAIDGEAKSAGGVQLLDDRFRRRRVGLISGANSEKAEQPLLSPLYYISRALGPFSEVREADNPNTPEAIKRLIEERSHLLILADIGQLPQSTETELRQWIDSGGVLIRFAGPRLAAADNDMLVPSQLRRGDRNLGGTLTWGTPQPLASFESNSPFAGLPVPSDVTVNRQVLAEPDIDLRAKTWASLADGTPLVTAAKQGNGWLILFHVTADNSWSNLPLSGAFVDMLRRIVTVANGVKAKPTPSQNATSSIKARANDQSESILPPLRSLNAYGVLGAPPADAKPLTKTKNQITEATQENPPGLYGSNDAFSAINLFNGDADLSPLDQSVLPKGAQLRKYLVEKPLNIKPWLLAAALLLLTLDCLAVLWLAGALQQKMKPAAALLAICALSIGMMGSASNQAAAQSESSDQATIIDFERSLKTRLAFVKTGIDELDIKSRKGLSGLTAFITSRTSLEPGEPVGIDISSEELAFYPLLYWPVSANSSVPDAATMSRIDVFMKKGGSVLFDTQDQLTGGFGAGRVSPATLKLREILATLDIPPLEPVPENHVLTRAFYLLDAFPGRYHEGRLWVETSPDTNDPDRPTRQGDGVSSIMITSNDFAGAWAVEASGVPTLPIVPPNPNQRTYAFRTGVNIIMYTLTGNYKSDQVHIPALLERLGQ